MLGGLDRGVKTDRNGDQPEGDVPAPDAFIGPCVLRRSIGASFASSALTPRRPRVGRAAAGTGAAPRRGETRRPRRTRPIGRRPRDRGGSCGAPGRSSRRIVCGHVRAIARRAAGDLRVAPVVEDEHGKRADPGRPARVKLLQDIFCRRTDRSFNDSWTSSGMRQGRQSGACTPRVRDQARGAAALTRRPRKHRERRRSGERVTDDSDDGPAVAAALARPPIARTKSRVADLPGQARAPGRRRRSRKTRPLRAARRKSRAARRAPPQPWTSRIAGPCPLRVAISPFGPPGQSDNAVRPSQRRFASSAESGDSRPSAERTRKDAKRRKLPRRTESTDPLAS